MLTGSGRRHFVQLTRSTCNLVPCVCSKSAVTTKMIRLAPMAQAAKELFCVKVERRDRMVEGKSITDPTREAVVFAVFFRLSKSIDTVPSTNV